MLFQIWIIFQCISKAVHPPLLTEQQITASHSDCAGVKLFWCFVPVLQQINKAGHKPTFSCSPVMVPSPIPQSRPCCEVELCAPSMGLHWLVFHQWDDELAGKKMSQYILPFGHGSNLPWFPWCESEMAQLHPCKLDKPYWPLWNDWIWPIALLLCY